MRYLDLKLFASLFLFLTAFPTFSHADVIVSKDTVTGTVIGKDKEPLPGAKVEIIGQPYSAFTDIDGRFNIRCDQGAKKVRVSYPRMRDVKKKIYPNMTVRIGRNWRQAPENYQWFVGANIGIGGTFTDFYNYNPDYVSMTDQSYFYYDKYEELFVAPNISVMLGRVKKVGWYLKGFATLPSKGIDIGFEKATSGGAIAGMMLRLWCPLHFYYGFGFGYTDLSKTSKDDYNGWSVQFDLGLLFRIKDNYGINLSMNAGGSRNIVTGSYMNLGFAYFFDK